MRDARAPPPDPCHAEYLKCVPIVHDALFSDSGEMTEKSKTHLAQLAPRYRPREVEVQASGSAEPVFGSEKVLLGVFFFFITSNV